MMAIATALQRIEELRVILSTDLCSALMLLESFTSHSRQDIVNEIYETLYRFKRMNICINFMWIPAHRGIKGTYIEDGSAKQALKHEQIMDIAFSKMEAKGIIKTRLDYRKHRTAPLCSTERSGNREDS